MSLRERFAADDPGYRDDLRRAAAYLRRVPPRGDEEQADLVRLVELFEREGRA
jgi:hypothetical protein